MKHGDVLTRYMITNVDGEDSPGVVHIPLMEPMNDPIRDLGPIPVFDNVADAARVWLARIEGTDMKTAEVWRVEIKLVKVEAVVG